jgi:hypothetical protein
VPCKAVHIRTSWKKVQPHEHVGHKKCCKAVSEDEVRTCADTPPNACMSSGILFERLCVFRVNETQEAREDMPAYLTWSTYAEQRALQQWKCNRE